MDMNQQELQTLNEIKALSESTADDVQTIKSILGGDWKTGKDGLVQSQARVLNELYHVKTGVLVRLGLLETTKIRAFAYGSAASAIVTGIIWFLVEGVPAIIQVMSASHSH